MRKVMLLAAALCALALSGAAGAKTVAVDISQAGFVPADVTLQAGDTVTFTNKDTVNHQVVCQSCPFTSPVLKPGETFSFTFTKAGKFTYTDPLNKNKKGTATVTAEPATLSLTATPTTVTYGGTTTLAGKLSTGLANVKVDVLAQQCGENAAKTVGTATTASDGTFTFAVKPAKNTVYTARTQGPARVSTSPVTVKVRPRVSLQRLALGKFSVRVTAADSFVGKSVAFQRFVASTSTWRTVRAVVLRTQVQSATPLPGTYVTGASFKLRLKSGYRVRAVLPPAQAGTCYLAARSSVVRS